MTKHATKTKGVHYDRTVARRKAVQLLYQAQILGLTPLEVLEQDSYIEEIGVLPDYSRMLIMGLNEHLQEVDDCLAQSSDHWSLSRMPLVDRCILRLAIYEMRYVESVPVSVSINEAIELAHEFGGEDESGSFVNGVLGNIARSPVASEEQEAAEPAEAEELAGAGEAAEPEEPTGAGEAAEFAEPVDTAQVTGTADPEQALEAVEGDEGVK
jgi:N utilization substance protein B